MLVPFSQLPNASRIWIYQANKLFTKTDEEILSTMLSSFLEKWTAHGNTLQAGFDLPFRHFIVIGLNEDAANASGCSIDSLFRSIQEMGAKTTIDFFNRNLIAFKEGDGIVLYPRTSVKEKVANAGALALTFNNLVTTKEALSAGWVVPVKDTWLNRYLAPVSV
jgi:hypothetical protein